MGLSGLSGLNGNRALGVNPTDPDALTYWTAAGLTDNIHRTAIDSLVKALKANGTWAKYRAIYPFVGGTASTHRLNLKDPQDTDAAFRLVPVGTVTHSGAGVTGDGSTGYLDTRYIGTIGTMMLCTPSTLASSSTHGADMYRIYPRWWNGVTYWDTMGSTTERLALANAAGSAIGVVGWSRTPSGQMFGTRNGSVVTVGTASASAAVSLGLGQSPFILAQRDSAGGPISFSADTVSFFAIASTPLTPLEHWLDSIAIQRYNNMLGRSAGTAGFPWASLPQVPTAKRVDVEAACALAAMGQSYTALDVFNTVAASAYYWSFEPGSVFSDTAGTIPANISSLCGSARDWKTGALLTQGAPSSQPILEPRSLWLNESMQLAGAFALTDNTTFSTYLVVQALSTKGGSFLKVGDTSPGGGWGIGIGGTSHDTNGNNVTGLHEWNAWVTSTTPYPGGLALVSLVRSGGTSTMALNGTTVATHSTAINTPTANTYLNGLSPRRTTFRAFALLSFNAALSATQQAQVLRYLQAYYTF